MCVCVCVCVCQVSVQVRVGEVWRQKVLWGSVGRMECQTGRRGEETEKEWKENEILNYLPPPSTDTLTTRHLPITPTHSTQHNTIEQGYTSSRNRGFILFWAHRKLYLNISIYLYMHYYNYRYGVCACLPKWECKCECCTVLRFIFFSSKLRRLRFMFWASNGVHVMYWVEGPCNVALVWR